MKRLGRSTDETKSPRNLGPHSKRRTPTRGATPELKTFERLEPSDFERHPIWLCCHGRDQGEPWYGETSEETFRPWDGPGPVTPSHNALVRACFTMKDNSQWSGFVTPAAKNGAPLDTGLGTLLGAQAPHIFINGKRYGFWFGLRKPTQVMRSEFYAAIEKPPESIFPIKFRTTRGLAKGITSGELLGFYRFSTGKEHTHELTLVIER